MSEQLDNELRNRINEVFDNYEDTAPAQEGWLLLREKFPAKKERRILPIWWSAAAVFLILSLLGIWFYNTEPKKTQQVATVKPKSNQPWQSTGNVIKHQQSPLTGTQPDAKGTASTSPSTNNGQYLAKDKKPNTTNTNNAGITPVADYKPRTDASPYNVNTSLQPALAANTVSKNSATNNASAGSINPIVKANASQPDSTLNNKQIIIAQQPVQSQQKANTSILKDSSTNSNDSKMVAFLTNEQKKEDAKKTKQNNKPLADKKVLYSVYAATYFNYAEGSKSQINTGAGFSTDIKLFSNFKLSTGVAIGRNTLNYDSQPTQTGIVNAAVRAASSRGANDAMSSPNNSAYSNMLGVVPLGFSTNAVVAAYNVSLTGLDVPINIKYEFNPKKSDSYISAGLSSGTFINETFNYSYQSNVNALGVAPTIPDATTSQSFTRFDFARTLNVSLGMGYQITKSNRLVIEPFLKYPLSGLGSQQIRFGAGGVNLRLKFQTAKKK